MKPNLYGPARSRPICPESVHRTIPAMSPRVSGLVSSSTQEITELSSPSKEPLSPQDAPRHQTPQKFAARAWELTVRVWELAAGVRELMARVLAPARLSTAPQAPRRTVRCVIWCCLTSPHLLLLGLSLHAPATVFERNC